MVTHRANGAATGDAATLSGANDKHFDQPLAAVQQLVLLGGANRVRRAGERHKDDELWQGSAIDPSAPDAAAVAVYMRIGTNKTLVAELVCCCLAHELGLPAPAVYLVRIPPGALKNSKLAHANAETLCVATQDLGGETFTQLLDADSKFAVALLRNWPELAKVVAFDGWTANIDRNLGNIIYSHESLCIIDHAEAFGGAIESAVSLRKLTSMPLPNKLCPLLPGSLKLRTEVLDQLHAWLVSEVTAIDIAATFKRAGTRKWHGPARDKLLMNFLRERLPHTHAVLCDQLGLPQLKLS